MKNGCWNCGNRIEFFCCQKGKDNAELGHIGSSLRNELIINISGKPAITMFGSYEMIIGSCCPFYNKSRKGFVFR